MPASRKIIAVDMDEVIADALSEHLLRYNRDFHPDPNATTPLTLDDLHGRWLWDAVPPARVRDLERYMLSPDFFRVLPVMPDAQRVLARLQSRYDIFIASAAMEVPSSFTAKYQWLAEHFPFIPTSHIVFCGDKSILRADFLIDDNPRQLNLFQSTNPSSRPEHPAPNLSSGPERLIPSPSSSPESNSLSVTRSEEARGSNQFREGILYTSPANVHQTGFRRVDNWQDVETMFLP